MFYVYRFLNSQKEIIYIGKSKNLTHRLYSHFNNQQKEWMSEVSFVEVAKFQDGATMSIYELYYIDLFKPKYNRDGVYLKTNTYILLPEIQFNTYEFEYTKIKDIVGCDLNYNINKDDILNSFTLIVNKDMELSISDSIMDENVLYKIGNSIYNIKRKFKSNFRDGDIKISTSYTNLIPLAESFTDSFKNFNKIFIGKVTKGLNSSIILYIHPKTNKDIEDIIVFMQNNISNNKKYIYVPDKDLAKYIVEYFDYKIETLRIK